MPSYINPQTIDLNTQKSAPELQSNFDAIQAALNGGLDEVNVPNLAAAFTTYKTILWGGANATNGVVGSANFWGFWTGPAARADAAVWASGLASNAFHFDPADFAANARTTKLRLKASCIVNGTAPTGTSTVELVPVATFGGGAGATPTIATLGTAVVGSTVPFAAPAASSSQTLTSGDFNAPAAGYYVIGMATSAGYAAGAQVTFLVQLQMRQA